MASTSAGSAVLPRFRDKEYVNWVKVGQALKCTARGLGKFCKDRMIQYHQQLLGLLTLPRRCPGTCGYVTFIQHPRNFINTPTMDASHLWHHGLFVIQSEINLR